MKKQLLLLTLGLAGLFSAQAAEEYYLLRTNWAITPCSWINDIAPSGPVSCMIDDNLATYWHSNWSSDATDGYHWFIVDLGSEQSIDGFDYWRRQNSGNGNIKAGKVYVSNTAFSFPTHGDAKTYAENAENVPVGEFAFTYDEDPDGKRRCAFGSPVTGRYVFVYISEVSVSNSGTKDACCAEFKIYSTAEVTQEELIASYNDAIAAKKSMAEGFAKFSAVVGGEGVPDVSAPADLTVQNLEEKISAANTALQNYINQYNDKQVTIKAGIRRQESPYLAAVVTGTGVKYNTIPAVTPDAVWTIFVKDNGINLYNRHTGFYIGTNNGAQASANSAQLLVPGVILDSYVKFAKGTTTQLLNIDSYSNELTSWASDTDEGSTWVVEAADYDYAEPQLSTETEQHYYRIVSARWMYNHASPSMGVNGENRDGSGIGELNSRATASIPGIYWRIEDAGNGAVNLVNLTGYKLSYNADNQGVMAAEGTPLYLVKQTDAQFDGKTCYGITRNSAVSEYDYYDAAGDSGVGTFCWTPTVEGRGNGNNGSLWYFIPASDSEIEAATTAYINGVKTRFQAPVADAELAALMGEEFMQSISENYFADLTTVAGVNAAKASGSGSAKVAAIKTAVEEAVGSKLTAGYMIKNRNSNYTNCFLTAGLNEDGVTYQTTPTAAANDLNAIWSFEQKDGGYIIRSVNSNVALARIDEQSKPVLLTQDGLTYAIGYNPVVPGFNFTLMPQTESDTDMSLYALHQSHNELVCKWEAKNILGSHWSINPLNEATIEVQQGEGEGAGHVIALGEGVTVNDHETAAELVLTVTKKAGTGTQEGEIATAAVEPVDGVYSIKASEFVDNNNLSNLEEGEYELAAPAGYFLVNGASAGAVKTTFSVLSDGTTLGIDEVSAAAPAATEIYDLQGRRVNKVARGLYIINGKKVMVK